MLRPLFDLSRYESGKLIHRIVFAASFQRSVSREVLLVVIANVRSRHVLVFDAGNTLSNLLTLHVKDVAQHAQVTEVLFRKGIGRQCCGVIRRQRDQVMEDASVASRIGLESPDLIISCVSQLGTVIVDTHQLVAIVCRNVLAFFGPCIEDLLAEI